MAACPTYPDLVTVGQDGQTYYRVMSKTKKWNSAESYCHNWGFDGLATVTSEVMVRNLEALSIDTDVLIDVTNPNNQRCDSKTTCHLKLTNRAGENIATDVSYITNAFEIDQHLANDKLCIKRMADGRWQDEYCYNKKSVLCYQSCAPEVKCNGDSAPGLANSEDNNAWSASNMADVGDAIR